MRRGDAAADDPAPAHAATREAALDRGEHRPMLRDIARSRMQERESIRQRAACRRPQRSVQRRARAASRAVRRAVAVAPEPDRVRVSAFRAYARGTRAGVARRLSDYDSRSISASEMSSSSTVLHVVKDFRALRQVEHASWPGCFRGPGRLARMVISAFAGAKPSDERRSRTASKFLVSVITSRCLASTTCRRRPRTGSRSASASIPGVELDHAEAFERCETLPIWPDCRPW